MSHHRDGARSAELERIRTIDAAIVGSGLTVSKRAYAALHFYNLLTPDGYNPKTKKGRAKGYSTAIMHFAPANLSGFDVCQYRSAGCTAACLNTAGHGGIVLPGQTVDQNEVQRARVARTLTYFVNRFLFNVVLVREIETHVRRATAHDLTPAVRLNGTSDLPWERIRLNDGRTVFETFPDVQFYDYTKHFKRAMASARGQLPANYRICFSRSETNWNECVDVLNAGGTVAVVFNICECKRACHHEIPESGATYNGFPVINGDADDLRHLDAPGVIVGLKAKGLAKSDASGFVVPMMLYPKVVKLRAQRRARALKAA